MAAVDIDRNLLFGVIALQDDLIDEKQFTDACALWALRLERPLADVLMERHLITDEDRREIERKIERKISRHGNIRASLAAVAAADARDLIRSVDHPDIRNSLSSLPPAIGHVLIETLIPPHEPGTSRYTLTRIHAEGGLGRVWLARDRDFHRGVALKEIRPDRAANPELWRRFLKEAQITGQLEHPNIVPVYELGRRREDDQPFYTMRFVRGQSLLGAIREFHRERAGKVPNRLALQSLLGAFLKVCDAIGYAHARGVVHRDLKPENVVLGGYGEVVVLDWGLAKLVDMPEERIDPDAETVDRVSVSVETRADQTHGLLGTPCYMAPEQVEEKHDQIDGRTDVYALGGILFEILTGHPPAEGTTTADVLEGIRAGRTPRARQVDPTVPRALEAVCAKAMALERSKRYAKAVDLAAEVRRWIADEPVTAFREPWPDRARRWSRKHRTLVTSAAAVLVSVLIGSVGFAAVVTGKNRELARQTERAEQREQMAIKAVERFRDVVVEEPVLKNNPALEELRKKLLKEPLAFFRSLRHQLQADHDTRPEALARLANALHDYADLTEEIGDIQDGLRSHVECLAIWEKLVRAHPAITDYQQGLATIENCRGNMLSATGHPEQALASYGKALAILDRLARDKPSVTEFQSDLAMSYHNIGLLQSDTGHPDQALESYAKALAIQERLVRENPSVTEFQTDLAGSHHSIGLLRSDTGHPDQALESYGKALAIHVRLARENPSVTEFLCNLALSHRGIGHLRSATGDPDRALGSYGKALAILDRLARDNPSVTRFKSDLAGSHHNIAILQDDTGHPDQALESFGRALAIQDRLALESPSVTAFQNDLANTNNSIGALQRDTGHQDQALESYGKALAILGRLARDNPSVTEFQSELARSHGSIGYIQRDAGHPDQALVSYGKALAIQERLARENPSVTALESDLANSHSSIGYIQRDTGHPDEALKSYGKALVIQERLARQHSEAPAYTSDLGGTLSYAALIDLGAKRFDRARDKLEQAISCQKKALATNPRTSTYRHLLRSHLTSLVIAARALGNEDQARAAQREADELAAGDPATVAIDKRLAAVIRGAAPKDNRERLQLAYRAYETKLNGASARLFAEALAADPELVQDHQRQHGYNAACAAALAAGAKTSPTQSSPIKGETKHKKSSPLVGENTGGGADARLTEADRAKLRSQARAWLAAELKTWSDLLESAKPEQRRAIAETLKHWQQDTDLEAIRDGAALASLPENERKGWTSLWANVDALLKKALSP